MKKEKQWAKQPAPSCQYDWPSREGRSQRQMAVAAAEFAERWKRRCSGCIRKRRNKTDKRRTQEVKGT